MFHCIPFLAGAAAGAVVTYIAKDRQTRERIAAGADKIVEGLKGGLERTAEAVEVTTGSSHRDRQEDSGLDAQPSAI